MELKLYNTLTRTKEPFRPIDPAHVRMYVCGPTVYDFAHIGNARPVIVFDVLFRLLRHLAKQGVWDGGKGKTEVRYVRNITDVDDKINARAAEEYPNLPLNDAIRAVTEKTAKQFHDDVGALGCLPPTFEPRATEFVQPRPDGKTDMVSLIQRLIDNGHAYKAGGEVLFDTKSMSDYGELSKRNLEDQLEGVRIEVDDHKKNPADFVLWKQSSGNEPGWESPWGRGRPGWHIECSAMSAAYLGETFDIHGGGLDLIFPHHENEIAQSRCAFHSKVMANVWMHNGFLQVEGEKMSKSLGNFITIRQLRDDGWRGEVIRLAMLMTHYRSPLDFSLSRLKEADALIRKWFDVEDFSFQQSGSDAFQRPLEALKDDLNTPQVFFHVHHILQDALDEKNWARGEMQFILSLTGIIDARRASEARGLLTEPELSVDEEQAVENLIARRLAARKAKDFKESDRIRDELKAKGVVLKDNKDGTTTWEVAR